MTGDRRLDLDALAGHTPGPWSILPAKDTGGGPLVGWSLQSERCYLCIIRHEDGQATAADAALIAAAPELLAECRRLRAEVAKVSERHQETLCQLRNSNAVATGLRDQVATLDDSASTLARQGLKAKDALAALREAGRATELAIRLEMTSVGALGSRKKAWEPLVDALRAALDGPHGRGTE